MSSLPRSHVVGAVCAVVMLLVASQPAAAAGGRGGFSTIEPGRHPALHVEMPVNIVFVGYQPKSINVGRILSQLPAHGDPTVRADPDFGISGTPQDVGLRYDYHYNVRFAGSAFDDAFFAYLGSIAIEGPPSYYQQLYNAAAAQQPRRRAPERRTSTRTRRRPGSRRSRRRGSGSRRARTRCS